MTNNEKQKHPIEARIEEWGHKLTNWLDPRLERLEELLRERKHGDPHD